MLAHRLQKAAIAQLQSKCIQEATSEPDIWCERNRIMGKPIGGPWSFHYHPWLRDMIKSPATENVGQKSAQMGYTEVTLNRALYTIIKLRRDVLYVLPAKTPDATDFSSARFDPALELSPALAGTFTRTKNVGLKRSGTNSMYIRGSRSASALKSIPVSLLILDEVEEISASTIALARERLSGQLDFQLWQISTPRIPNRGINFLFNRSSQDHFMFKCPHCSRHTELLYPDCLVVCGENETDPDVSKSHLICKECRHKLEHKEKVNFLKDAFWEATHAQRSVRGFYINQLYSSMPACHPVEIAKCVHRAVTSPADEQELYNSKLGLPHIVDGANVTEAHVHQCIRDYRQPDRSRLQGHVITMGVDVGTYCHFVIYSWVFDQDIQIADINSIATPFIIWADKTKNYQDLHKIMRTVKPNMTVIDNLPDTRASLEFARVYPGLVKLCSYTNANREITSAKEISNLHNERITVERTTWLDLSLSRYMNKRIHLPANISSEFKSHITAPVRIYKENPKTGERVATYVNKGPDHYAHAGNYAEIALKVFSSLGSTLSTQERTY